MKPSTKNEFKEKTGSSIRNEKYRSIVTGSLLQRNEELAMEIGMLIAKNRRLQSNLRKLQRESYILKIDSSTQTCFDLAEVL